MPTIKYKAVDSNNRAILPNQPIPGQLNLLTCSVQPKELMSAATATSAQAMPSTGSKMSHSGVNMEELLQKYETRIRELEIENAKLRQQQVEIEKAKELYLKIFEDFPALIWRSRLDKMCDYFNRTWLEWTGKTLDQEFGTGWTEGVHKEDYDHCLETYVEAFDKREPFYMEYRLLNKHGEYRWIGDHGRPFYDMDGATFLGYIGSCYDITENKRNEQKLVNLNATKDRFFSIVAHDLRNPISTFVGVSEMLMEDADSFEAEELKEIATQMHKDSKNTLLLLENILDWSKTQSGDIKYHPTDVYLPDLCQQVVSQVELCATAKNISVQYIDTMPDLSVSADENMLKTIIRNLIMNGIKYTNAGGKIEIHASEHYEPGASTQKHILLQVQDTGVGMSDEQVQRLFTLPGECGRYTSTPGTNDEGGTGLGLVICRDFVEKHNGRIWAESKQGIGTTFTISIPCE